ncbi:MAG: CHAT domain-containing protein [Acidobacteriota bacterium]
MTKIHCKIFVCLNIFFLLQSTGLATPFIQQPQNPISNSTQKAAVPDEKIQKRINELLEQGNTLLAAYEVQKIFPLLEEGLKLSRQIQSLDSEVGFLALFTSSYYVAGDKAKSIDYGKQLIDKIDATDAKDEKFVFLGLIAKASKDLQRYDEAINYYQQCLAALSALKEKPDTLAQYELTTLINLGELLLLLKRFDACIGVYTRSVELTRKLNQPGNQGLLLVLLAKSYIGNNENEKGISQLDLAKPMLKDTKDSELKILEMLVRGEANLNLGRFEEALKIFSSAYLTAQQLNARIYLISLSNMIGRCHLGMGNYDEAFKLFDRSLALVRDTQSNRQAGIQEILSIAGNEGDLLNSIGQIYSDTGQHERALEYFKQAREASHKIGAITYELAAINNIGQSYTYLRNHTEARKYYLLALDLQKQISNRAMEALILNNLASTHLMSGETDEAIHYFKRAIEISQETRQRIAESWALQNYGYALQRKGELDQAMENYLKALMLARELKNIRSESFVLTLLMLGWMEKANPKLAIFFGKQAINLFQKTRKQLVNIDKDSQQSFIQERKDVYKILADLLIEEGRLPEAQQVLDLLKQEEFYEFVRRDSNATTDAKNAELSSEESQWEQRYLQIADRVTSIGFEYNSLLSKLNRTSADETRLVELEKDLEVAGQAFQKFINDLKNEAATRQTSSNRIAQIEENQGLRNDLEELGDNSVALYTLVLKDKLRIILITPKTQKAAEFAIPEAELSKKIFAFRQALQTPAIDPQPLAQELYKIIFAPIAKDLEGARARTLMWSLEGILRYLPIAALHDGNQYLVEKYRNVIFTPASNARLKDPVSPKWRGIGLGVSKGADGFVPLPGVLKELNTIFNIENRDKPNPMAGGILPGVVKLDEEFTAEAFKAALRQKVPVVHIASHFQFKPGNETNSFLLLGDGSHLSLAELKRLPSIFNGVELLTLSACQTAVGSTSDDGKEVDGLAIVAQQQGAKAIIASLWSVADESTSLLMREFYSLRESNKGLSKAEALRQAQLKLLNGKVTGKPLTQMQRGPISEDLNKEKKFVVNPKAPFAHPYFWAPFILIGNWK